MRVQLNKKGVFVQYLSVGHRNGRVDGVSLTGNKLSVNSEKAVDSIKKSGRVSADFDEVLVPDEVTIALLENKAKEAVETDKVAYSPSKIGKFEAAFAESEREREVKELEIRKENFRKTYKPK
uniref:Uncharacterized protein n=1 Tax=uncultured Thiotrichaceae bacterium TaxID=298394 RepID=A0A6S6U5V9_9GAMM|nr:MAG: Unknown protein [uncultured Thiotrichaceae bacterium]